MPDKNKDLKEKSKSQDLEIVELRIQMHTNMDTQVELTADLIDNKKVSGKYPFLCTNLKYSDAILKEKSQNEIFDIFFNRQKFYNFLLASKLKKTQKADTRYDKEIVKKNIVQMLNALFPISFPIKDQISTMTPENIEIMEMITNFLKSNKYTYLKLNKPSTVTQVIWLNTISSNPIFYEIYRKNKNFYKKVLDYAESVPSTRDIVNDKNLLDKDKINKIQNQVKNIYGIPDKARGTKEINVSKEECILHFLVSSYRKNTIEYNEFIKKYVKKFINSEDNNRYYNTSQQQYEKQFYESVPEIKFYQKYITDIVELLPPKRISLDTKISEILKKAKDNNDFADFIDLYTGKKKDPHIDPQTYDCNLIRLDNGAYEIHVGVAVVGGKVNQTNSKFLCNYNSHRLGNNLNFLIRDIEENTENIRLYSYIDLENVKDTNEYIGVINSSIKKKDVQNENKQKGGKTRRRRVRSQKKTRRLREM